MALLDDLEAEVKETVGTEESATKLIDGFAARLQAAQNSGDSARVQAVIDAMKAVRAPLAAAVAANP
jgi:cell division septum initiation protein DivIVA